MFTENTENTRNTRKQEKTKEYSIAEAARLLKISYSTVRRMVLDGRLEGRKINNHGDLRISEKAIADMIRREYSKIK